MKTFSAYGIAIAFFSLGQGGIFGTNPIYAQISNKNHASSLSTDTLEIRSYLNSYFQSRPEIKAASLQKSYIQSELEAISEKWHSNVELKPFLAKEETSYSLFTPDAKQSNFMATTKLNAESSTGTSAYAGFTQQLLAPREENAQVTKGDFQIGLSQELNQNALGKQQKLREEYWQLSLQSASLEQQKTAREICSRGMSLFNRAFYMEQLALFYKEFLDPVQQVFDKMRKDRGKSLVSQADFLSIRNDLITAKSDVFKAEKEFEEAVLGLGIDSQMRLFRDPDNFYRTLYSEASQQNNEPLEIMIKKLYVAEKNKQVAIAELEQRTPVKIFSEYHQAQGTLPGEESWNSRNFLFGITATLPLKDPGGDKLRRQALILEKSAETELLLSQQNFNEKYSILKQKYQNLSEEESLASDEIEAVRALVTEQHKLLKSYRISLYEYRQSRDQLVQKKLALLGIRKTKWDVIAEIYFLSGNQNNLCTSLTLN